MQPRGLLLTQPALRQLPATPILTTPVALVTDPGGPSPKPLPPGTGPTVGGTCIDALAMKLLFDSNPGVQFDMDVEIRDNDENVLELHVLRVDARALTGVETVEGT